MTELPPKPSRARAAKGPAGPVALVGGGSGDPSLLVVRAAELLRSADLVVADERCAEALLAALEAGCTAPVGALAQVAEGDDGLELYLRGLVAAVDGTDAVRLSTTGPTSEAAAVGRRLAAELLDLGAADLMGVIRT